MSEQQRLALDLLARFNMPHQVEEDHGSFLYELYQLLRQAPPSVSTWAKQRAFECAADTKMSWRVVAVSEDALRQIVRPSADEKLQRGHFFGRRERFNAIFDTSRQAWGKQELLAFFFDNDACALVTSTENGRDGVAHWSQLHQVPSHIFTSTGFDVRVRKRVDMPWVMEQVARLGL
jgi:hypothetical protein